MRCEVVAVGTELLLGQIVDTNSSWIGEQLALAGIDSHYQTKVGDNLERMIGCIRLGLERGDAVITCGGLGPTQDDITREAIAEVMGVPLVRQADMGEKIRALFERRGRVMTENNLRQADLPGLGNRIGEGLFEHPAERRARDPIAPERAAGTDLRQDLSQEVRLELLGGGDRIVAACGGGIDAVGHCIALT